MIPWPTTDASATHERRHPPLRPERSTAEWQALDAAHYLHPFTDHAALSRKGTRLDTRRRRVPLRVRRPSHPRRHVGTVVRESRLRSQGAADAAYRQLLELPYYNSFFQVSHPPAIELARLLVEVTPPQFNHVFFTGSGSEANDTVVRSVRRYWDVMGQPQRTFLISRNNAYHGSTIAGASLGGMAPMHAQGGLPIPGIVHIRQPYWYAEGGELSPEGFGPWRPGRSRRRSSRSDPSAS